LLYFRALTATRFEGGVRRAKYSYFLLSSFRNADEFFFLFRKDSEGMDAPVYVLARVVNDVDMRSCANEHRRTMRSAKVELQFAVLFKPYNALSFTIKFPTRWSLLLEADGID
jgi:hypothetical protein